MGREFAFKLQTLMPLPYVAEFDDKTPQMKAWWFEKNCKGFVGARYGLDGWKIVWKKKIGFWFGFDFQDTFGAFVGGQ